MAALTAIVKCYHTSEMSAVNYRRISDHKPDPNISTDTTLKDHWACFSYIGIHLVSSARYGVRQNRVYLIKGITFFSTIWKASDRFAVFAGALNQIADFKIESVVVYFFE